MFNFNIYWECIDNGKCNIPVSLRSILSLASAIQFTTEIDKNKDLFGKNRV